MSNSVYQVGLGDDENALLPGYRWVNGPTAFLRGPVHHPLGLYEHTGVGTGMPDDMETPVFAFDLTNGSKLSDFEIGDGTRWLVSARAKQVFQAVDKNAFVFRKATTHILDNSGERAGPDYFLCDVVRFVDAVDEGRSEVRVEEAQANRQRSVLVFLGAKNVFRRSAVGDSKIFRLMFTPDTIACTETLRGGVMEAELTNVTFKLLGKLDG